MSRRTGRAAVAARAGGVALAALLLAGCAADVEGELRREVANLTDDVNAEDADGVRDSAESLIARTQQAVRDNDIAPDEGARIIELATLLRDRYAALQPAEPTATPSASPTPSAEPTEVETEEPEETEAPAPPSPSPRPTTARPTTPPPSPPTEPSPTAPATVLPEVPEG